MDDYNKYVTAVNKIFDYISKMRIAWSNIDNINYIDSIEEFKNAVTSNAEAFKKAPDPALMVNDEEGSEQVGTQPVEQVQKLDNVQPAVNAPNMPQPAPKLDAAPVTSVQPQIPNLAQENVPMQSQTQAQPPQLAQQVPSIPQINAPAQQSPLPTLANVPGQTQ